MAQTHGNERSIEEKRAAHCTRRSWRRRLAICRIFDRRTVDKIDVFDAESAYTRCWLCNNQDMTAFSLANHFLIAMPNLADSIFAKSLVYLCEHSKHGAMGIVVNRPADMRLGELFEQVNLPLMQPDLDALPVYLGGPVQTDRGFVLHQPIGNWQSSMIVTDSTALSTSRDILNAVSAGEGPERLFVSLGYSGWDAGQLEFEIAQNTWLTVPAPEDLDIIFDVPAELRRDAAMALLGVDPLTLSSEAGHA